MIPVTIYDSAYSGSDGYETEDERVDTPRKKSPKRPKPLWKKNSRSKRGAHPRSHLPSTRRSGANSGSSPPSRNNGNPSTPTDPAWYSSLNVSDEFQNRSTSESQEIGNNSERLNDVSSPIPMVGAVGGPPETLDSSFQQESSAPPLDVSPPGSSPSSFEDHDVDMGDGGTVTDESASTSQHAPDQSPFAETVHQSPQVQPVNSASGSHIDDGHDNQPDQQGTLQQLQSQISFLTTGIQNFSELMTRQYASITSRMEELERRSSAAAASEEPTPGRQRRKPYDAARRRSKVDNATASLVRQIIDELLDAYGDPFVSSDEAKAFAQRARLFPEKTCCSATTFQIDVDGGPHSAWNVSAASIVLQEVLRSPKCTPSADEETISQAFHTRLKSIKQSLKETDAQKVSKAAYGRKYGLYQRRFETLASVPDLKAHVPIFRKLGVDAMSSDEEDDDEESQQSAKNPSYRVLSPRWRSKELTNFLHVIDSIYILQRRFDNTRQRGNWPRSRYFNAVSPTVSSSDKFPKGLPKNAYNQQWLNGFSNAALTIKPAEPYDFKHSPDIFQFLMPKAP